MTMKIPDKCVLQYDSDLPALNAALTGPISGTSALVETYERRVSEVFGASQTVAVSSGGAAISVALGALGVGPGDEVVLTPTCPLCTLYPILALGATPVFVDTKPDAFVADPSALAALLGPRVKAVIEIPMWGYPTELRPIRELTRNAGVPLLLDLAHAHGAMLDGRPLHLFGDLSCYSTHERKILTTGEGGFILTESARLADACRSYSRFGNLDGVSLGLNYKLSGLQAALGTSRLGSISANLEARRVNAKMFREAVALGSGVRELSFPNNSAPSYYSLVLCADKGMPEFRQWLEAVGIPSDVTRYDCRCLYEHPVAHEFRSACPNAAALLQSVTTIPVHPGLTANQREHVVAALRNLH
jgi:dTDP-4-amino-4,6-dideoxygalactose transaminase